MSPGQTHSAGTTKSRVSGSPDGAASRPPGPLPAQCLPPQGPCGTPMGSPGTEHPSLTPPSGLFPPGRGKAVLQSGHVGAPRGRERGTAPTPSRPAGSPEPRASPPAPPAGTHQPSPGAVAARSRPCMAGSAQPLRRVAPRSGMLLPLLKVGSKLSPERPCALSFSFSPAEPFLPSPEWWVNTARAAEETT